MNRPEINVTPLIDVLLVLLIIFMVIAPIKPSSFDARIPSESLQPPDKPNPLTIVTAYKADSSILINDRPSGVSIAETGGLTDQLKAIFNARKKDLGYEKTVFIKAPKSLNYGSVVLLIDAVKAAGGDPVSLLIDDLDG
jgi:biopolymer transport protein ExbD